VKVDFHTEKYRAFYDRVLLEITERRRTDQKWSTELDLQLADILAVYAFTYSVSQFFLITLSGSYVRFERSVRYRKSSSLFVCSF
jgi:hypothetical protein